MTATAVRYIVTVTLTQPVDDFPNDFLTKASKRIIEKYIIRALRHLDGDADCEVMEAELIDADGLLAETPKGKDR